MIHIKNVWGEQMSQPTHTHSPIQIRNELSSMKVPIFADGIECSQAFNSLHYKSLKRATSIFDLKLSSSLLIPRPPKLIPKDDVCNDL